MTHQANHIEAFETQKRWCARMGSPMYAALLASAAADISDGGPTYEVVGSFEGDPTRHAVPLRLLGGVHRLVLSGEVSALAEFYPTVGGAPGMGMEAAFLDVLAMYVERLREAIGVAPQTNEIGRSAALLPGMSACVGSTKLPVRLFEIGASSGLNLLLDHYRYELGDVAWGDPTSDAVIRAEWIGKRPSLFESVEIAERRGCDISPVDVTKDVERLKALSFVWADQMERFSRMSAAIGVARRLRPVVDRADALPWVDTYLDKLEPGYHTVLQHSIMWQYLSDESQQGITDVIERVGATATSTAPFSHVRFEPPPLHYKAKGHVLTVTTWPDRTERILAVGHAHGSWIEWVE